MQSTHTNECTDVCLTTLLYYQLLGNIPLTATEVWWYQMNAHKQPPTYSLLARQQHLALLAQENKVSQENGFFALQNETPCYEYRAQCILESIHKWFLIQNKARFLPYIPFVRHLRVLGSVSTGSATRKSDLDVSICSAMQHIWSVRFFTNAFAELFSARRHRNTTQNKLCFNHYTSKSNAPYASNNPLFFQVEKQSIVLWDTQKHAIMSPHRFGLGIKKIVETILNTLRLAHCIEGLCSATQIKKIRNNPTPYPPQLPPLTRDSWHLVFYYPKIQTMEQQMKMYELSTGQS